MLVETLRSMEEVRSYLNTELGEGHDVFEQDYSESASEPGEVDSSDVAKGQAKGPDGTRDKSRSPAPRALAAAAASSALPGALGYDDYQLAVLGGQEVTTTGDNLPWTAICAAVCVVTISSIFWWLSTHASASAGALVQIEEVAESFSGSTGDESVQEGGEAGQADGSNDITSLPPSEAVTPVQSPRVTAAAAAAPPMLRDVGTMAKTSYSFKKARLRFDPHMNYHGEVCVGASYQVIPPGKATVTRGVDAQAYPRAAAAARPQPAPPPPGSTRKSPPQTRPQPSKMGNGGPQTKAPPRCPPGRDCPICDPPRPGGRPLVRTESNHPLASPKGMPRGPPPPPAARAGAEDWQNDRRGLIERADRAREELVAFLTNQEQDGSGPHIASAVRPHAVYCNWWQDTRGCSAGASHLCTTCDRWFCVRHARECARCQRSACVDCYAGHWCRRGQHAGVFRALDPLQVMNCHRCAQPFVLEALGTCGHCGQLMCVGCKPIHICSPRWD